MEQDINLNVFGNLIISFDDCRHLALLVHFWSVKWRKIMSFSKHVLSGKVDVITFSFNKHTLVSEIKYLLYSLTNSKILPPLERLSA